MPLAQFNESHAVSSNHSFLIADGTTQIGLASSMNNDYRWDQIYATNTDGIDHVVNLAMVYGPPDQHMLSVNVPAGSGSAGVPPVDLLLNAGTLIQPGIVVAVGQQMVANLEVAVVADNTVQLTAFGGTL